MSAIDCQFTIDDPTVAATLEWIYSGPSLWEGIKDTFLSRFSRRYRDNKFGNAMLELLEESMSSPSAIRNNALLEQWRQEMDKRLSDNLLTLVNSEVNVEAFDHYTEMVKSTFPNQEMYEMELKRHMEIWQSAMPITVKPESVSDAIGRVNIGRDYSKRHRDTVPGKKVKAAITDKWDD